jgi:hypothetical protein
MIQVQIQYSLNNVNGRTVFFATLSGELLKLPAERIRPGLAVRVKAVL